MRRFWLPELIGRVRDRFRGCAPQVADRMPSRLMVDEGATPVAPLQYQRDSIVRQVSLE
jgi:hypothetical protein